MDDVPRCSAIEGIARMIETVYLPAYSPANRQMTGRSVSRDEVYDDLKRIISDIRSADRKE